MSEIPAAVVEWLLGDERGASSTVMCRAICGFPVGGPHGTWHPHDPDDLRRCVQFLDQTGTRDRLGMVAAVSPVWAALVDHWDELEALLREEMPTGRAPRCYKRMKEIIEGARGGTS